MSQSTLKVQPNRTSKIEALLQEVEQIPDEHLGNLVQIVRLFRESLLKEEVNTTEIQRKARLLQQYQSLQDLNKEWIDEGDEVEQTETWEYLNQALNI